MHAAGTADLFGSFGSCGSQWAATAGPFAARHALRDAETARAQGSGSTPPATEYVTMQELHRQLDIARQQWQREVDIAWQHSHWERDFMRQQLGSVRQELRSLRQQLGSIWQELGSVRQELRSLRQELESMQQQLKSVQQQLGSMQEQLGSTQQQLGEHAAGYDAATAGQQG